MKKCPYCGSSLFILDLNCPYCKKPIRNYFSIEAFLKENFHLFTIIGVLGTMISLLPNLGNLVFGQNWLIKDYFNIFSWALILIIYFGGLFIIVIFILIFWKIFQDRDNENFNTIFFVFHWHYGDFQRIILLVCLAPLMLGLILFIFPSIMFLPNNSVIAGFLLVILMFFGTMSIIQFLLTKRIVESAQTVSTEFGKYQKHTFVLLVVLVAIVYLLITMVWFPPGFTIPKPYSDDIKIKPDKLYFSPSMSDTPGLQLEVTNISTDQFSHTYYQWSTNFGYFISFTPSGLNGKILGDNCEANSTLIYWTYSTEAIEPNQSEVNIKLNIIDTKTNSIVFNKSENLNLTWFTRDIVFVNNSYQLQYRNLSESENRFFLPPVSPTGIIEPETSCTYSEVKYYCPNRAPLCFNCRYLEYNKFNCATRRSLPYCKLISSIHSDFSNTFYRLQYEREYYGRIYRFCP